MGVGLTGARRLEAAHVERITTVLELLELVRDERSSGAAMVNGMAVDAPAPGRRKSAGGAKAALEWPTLIVPLFNLLAVLQAPANACTFVASKQGVQGIQQAAPLTSGL